MGEAVLTSTSHKVSACAGIGSCVLGSTLGGEFSSLSMNLRLITHLLLLEHLYH
jgi:hypothetical protein